MDNAYQISKGPSGRIIGLRRLLETLERHQVEKVLQTFSLKSVEEYGFADSTDYDLVYNASHYPPKPILGLAAKYIVGRTLFPDEFTGGDRSACFAILRSLGFDIVRKKVGNNVQIRTLKNLTRYKKYSRKEIALIFEPNYVFSSGSGRWGIIGLVESPKKSGNFVLIVTLGEPTENNPYRDEITQDGYAIWESQTQQKIESETIQKLIAHDSTVNNIHLFVRSNSKSEYTYLGLVEYFSHDPNSSQPVHFIWEIQNWDLTVGDLNRLGLIFRAPIDPSYTQNKISAQIPILINVAPPNFLHPARILNKNFKPSAVIDWAAKDLRNRKLGLDGEKLVVSYEIQTLKNAGRFDLAEKVDHVALYDSTLGYDILSYKLDGTTKKIEVKTTQGPANTPFFISINEVLASREDSDGYCIYRLYNYSEVAKNLSFFSVEGDVEENFNLKPQNFKAYKKA